ncbi:unnamed protein product [Orchesella dallaii]|uniref:Uncharacterized protein n=1 Tax=Orchesella dallaii TaxID=48710 RepID=A0ABP1QM65_9HEXA
MVWNRLVFLPSSFLWPHTIVNDRINEAPIARINQSLSLYPLYFHVSSTVDLYRASVSQKDPKDAAPIASVYYDACLKWCMHSDGTITLKGVNGLKRVFETKPFKDNVNEYTFEALGGYQEKNDEQVGFGVGTNTPTLLEETKKLVLDHALSFEFNKGDFTELRYDTFKN